ncbi:E3 ubiquitin-protein ligase ring1-like [Phtheirospermum japonicum]|uniref:RING-type E3 ubiquitin transferase n=1 Tax=Phtheirospermum japonicum TaxID=374723 RepID=A0A830CI83_9LAMI|nr:E3 ubiquitin-protein ligase ring1-like [Phtheirospermum japonicum]
MNEGDCCVVCMDEFSRGCEAVCMPCEHVFHGDCITKWLRTSHFCPVCRFEMPTGCARKKVNSGGI